MNHDPLASMKRLEDAFGKLSDAFGQHRKRVMEDHARQQHAAHADRRGAQLQTDDPPGPAEHVSNEELSRALATAETQNRDLMKHGKVLQTKIESLQNQVRSDQAEVRNILQELGEIFSEIEDA